MAQMAKDLLAMQEARVPSLGQEDALEKGMATHSSILAWRIPRTEGPGGLQPTRLLCPWDFPGKSTGVGCHCLLQSIMLYISIYPNEVPR